MARLCPIIKGTCLPACSSFCSAADCSRWPCLPAADPVALCPEPAAAAPAAQPCCSTLMKRCVGWWLSARQQSGGGAQLHCAAASWRQHAPCKPQFCAAIPSPPPQQMGHLRAGVERVVQHFLVGPHAETKLALLPHLARLAAFAGRRDTADVLLPSLLTFFNSQSWQVG